MRVSILFFSLPRQYAPAMFSSLKCFSSPVEGRCGPRQRSIQPSL